MFGPDQRTKYMEVLIYVLIKFCVDNVNQLSIDGWPPLWSILFKISIPKVESDELKRKEKKLNCNQHVNNII